MVRCSHLHAEHTHKHPLGAIRGHILGVFAIIMQRDGVHFHCVCMHVCVAFSFSFGLGPLLGGALSILFPVPLLSLILAEVLGFQVSPAV